MKFLFATDSNKSLNFLIESHSQQTTEDKRMKMETQNLFAFSFERFYWRCNKQNTRIAKKNDGKKKLFESAESFADTREKHCIYYAICMHIAYMYFAFEFLQMKNNKKNQKE